MATEFDFNLSPFEFSNNFQPSNPFLGEVPILGQSDFSSSFEPSLPTFRSFDQSSFDNKNSSELGNKVLDFASGVTDLLSKFNEFQSFEDNASQLFQMGQEANVRNNLQPIISSVNEPGLEPFNRFNPTLNQFETLYGNEAARLESEDTFIPNVTGFNDEPRFLQSVRDQAQFNADNFMGTPTAQQIQQANELGQAMGTGNVSQVFRFGDDGTGRGQGVQYGTEFEPRTAEELNQLLGMQQMQANQNFVNSPYFQDAMTEMNAPLIESRQAFDNQSFLREARLDDRIPFNATFNYDEAGNKVLAGESAREAALQGGEGEMSYNEARKFVARQRDYRGNLEPMSTYNQRVEAFRAKENEKRARVSEVVANTQQFLRQNGINLETSAIRTGILSTGSAESFIRSYANVQEIGSEKQLQGLNDSIENFGKFGAQLETPKMMINKKTKDTLMLGLNQENGQWGYVDQGGKFNSVNILDYRDTSVTEITGARSNALEQQKEIFSEQSNINVLKRFKQDRALSQEGFEAFVTDIRGKIQNFIGKDLDPQAMRNAVAKAGFQALLGRIRIDVLGPGVLTEIDAQRLIEALGGYGNTSDRETTLFLVERMIKQKQNSMRGKLNLYNTYRNTFKELSDELPKMDINNVDTIKSLGSGGDISDSIDPTAVFK